MPVISSPPIQVGRVWRQTIVFGASMGVMVPVGATFRAEVRSDPLAVSALATLTTGNGNFERVDDQTLRVIVLPGDSSAWETALAGRWVQSDTGVRRAPVAFDIVRTDLSPPAPLFIRFTGEAEIPTTRG